MQVQSIYNLKPPRTRFFLQIPGTLMNWRNRIVSKPALAPVFVDDLNRLESANTAQTVAKNGCKHLETSGWFPCFLTEPWSILCSHCAAVKQTFPSVYGGINVGNYPHSVIPVRRLIQQCHRSAHTFSPRLLIPAWVGFLRVTPHLYPAAEAFPTLKILRNTAGSKSWAVSCVCIVLTKQDFCSITFLSGFCLRVTVGVESDWGFVLTAVSTDAHPHAVSDNKTLQTKSDTQTKQSVQI